MSDLNALAVSSGNIVTYFPRPEVFRRASVGDLWSYLASRVERNSRHVHCASLRRFIAHPRRLGATSRAREGLTELYDVLSNSAVVALETSVS